MQLRAILRPQLRIREAGPTDIDTALEIARRPTAAASLFLFGVGLDNREVVFFYFSPKPHP